MAIYIGLGSWLTFISAPSGLRRVFLIGFGGRCLNGLEDGPLPGSPGTYLGTVWTNAEAMIQVTALTGVYGLSLITAIAAAAPAALGYSVHLMQGPMELFDNSLDRPRCCLDWGEFRLSKCQRR